MHLHPEYDNVASEATDRGQASTGSPTGEDGHGATETSAGTRRAEEEYGNPQRALLMQEPGGGDTDASPPPERLHALSASGLRGGEGGGVPPPNSVRLRRAARARGGLPITAAQDPPVQRSPGTRGGPQPQQCARSGGGGGQAARTHRAQAEPGRRGGPP